MHKDACVCVCMRMPVAALFVIRKKLETNVCPQTLKYITIHLDYVIVCINYLHVIVCGVTYANS